jgi:hypothetical protein
MAASFNKTSWNQKGSVLGTEMRAFNNIGWHRGLAGDRIGLTGFGLRIPFFLRDGMHDPCVFVYLCQTELRHAGAEGLPGVFHAGSVVPTSGSKSANFADILSFC